MLSPSLNLTYLLRSLFCVILSGRFTQVLLYMLYSQHVYVQIILEHLLHIVLIVTQSLIG